MEMDPQYEEWEKSREQKTETQFQNINALYIKLCLESILYTSLERGLTQILTRTWLLIKTLWH